MAQRESDRWRVAPGDKLDLTKVDTRNEDGAPGDKEATKATYPLLRQRLWDLQERLWAEREQSLLIVLQAIDAGGKDGTVKHLARGLNLSGSRVVPFRAPCDHDLAHDFLWRVHRHTPGKGEIVVFNRSHYEDVLVVRVKELVPEQVWRGRYEHIRAFERLLVHAGTSVVKILLHISRDEQAERFRERLEDPSKHWKFNRADLAERARWDDYREAFTEAVVSTTTEDAPWFVVPADRKWYRNWAVSQIVIEALERMDPQNPVSDDLSDVVIE